MAIDPTVKRDIFQSSRRYRVDPNAAYAIASVEGGIRRGAVGDRGTSFGPFQLHIGGALPAGRGPAWANSPAGIDYAVRSMASKGVSGLTGRAAVEAISRRFERPSDPEAEIRRAMSFYGGSANAVGQAAPNLAGSSAHFGGVGTNAFASARQDLAGVLAKSLADYATTGQMSLNPIDLLNVSRVNTDPGPPGGLSPNTAPTFGGTMGSMSGKEQALIESMKHARSMGLRIGENTLYDKVDPVHVSDSYHYRYYPGKVSGRRVDRAADISGSSQQMGSFFDWERSRYGKSITEMFYDPKGGIKYGKPIKAIGGHTSHVHLAF